MHGQQNIKTSNLFLFFLTFLHSLLSSFYSWISLKSVHLFILFFLYVSSLFALFSSLFYFFIYSFVFVHIFFMSFFVRFFLSFFLFSYLFIVLFSYEPFMYLWFLVYWLHLVRRHRQRHWNILQSVKCFYRRSFALLFAKHFFRAPESLLNIQKGITSIFSLAKPTIEPSSKSLPLTSHDHSAVSLDAI